MITFNVVDCSKYYFTLRKLSFFLIYLYNKKLNYSGFEYGSFERYRKALLP